MIVAFSDSTVRETPDTVFIALNIADCMKLLASLIFRYLAILKSDLCGLAWHFPRHYPFCNFSAIVERPDLQGNMVQGYIG